MSEPEVPSKQAASTRLSEGCFSDVSSDNLSSLLNILPGVHFRYQHIPEKRGCFLKITGEPEKLLGLSDTALTSDSRHLWRKCIRTDLQTLEGNIVQCVQTRKTLNINWNIRHKNGLRELNVRAVCSQVNSDNSQIWVGVIQSAREITSDYQNSRLSQRVVDRVPCFIHRFRYFPDDRSKFEYVSQGVKEILGYTPDELYKNGNIIWDTMHPDDQNRVHNRMMKNIQDKTLWDCEWRAITKTGEVRWIREKGNPPIVMEDGSKVWECMIEDVSRKYNVLSHSGDDSRHIEQSLYKILSIIPGIVFQSRHYGDGHIAFEYISEASVDLLGIGQEALMENADRMWARFHPDDLPGLIESIHQTVSSHSDWDYTWRVLHDGVNEVWLRGLGRHFATLPDGSILRVGVCTDISHEKYLKNQLDNQTQTLQSNQQTLQKITDVIAGVIVQARYNADGPIEYQYVSKGVKELFGITSESLMADSQLFWKLCHPEDRQKVKASIHRAIISRDDWEESWRIRRPDNQLRWIRVSSRHYRTLADGTSIRVSCFVDVSHEQSLQTQLDSKDQKLRHSEQALTDITDLMPGVIMQVNRLPQTSSVTFSYISKGIQEVFGFKREQLIKNSQLFWDICHPDDLQTVKNTSIKATDERKDWNHSWRIIRPDNGQTRWIRVASRHFQTLPDGQVVRVGYFFDISHEKQLESDVLEARQLLVDVNNVIPGCVYMVRQTKSGSWNYPFMSAGGEGLFERPLEKIRHNSRLILEYCHPDDRDMLSHKLNNAFRYNGLMHVVWRIITPSGKVKWIRGDSRPFRTNDDGSILRAGFFIDVTRERELEENLQKTTQRLEMILQAIPGGLYQSEVTPDGQQTFLFANQTVWTQVGLPADTPLSDSYKLIEGIFPEDRKKHKESAIISRNNLNPRHLRFRFKRFDNGEIVHISVHTQPSQIEGSENVMFTGVALDVSHQAALEENLLEEKIRAEEASVAKSSFLANVSHEMRTPLNGILGYGQLLAHELHLTGQAARNLVSLRQCSNHLLAVINEVLDMAKIESGRLELEVKSMALYRLLDEVESVISPLADNKGLEFRLDTSENLPGYIKGDATRLRQILINLLNNAVKFTPKGEVSLHVSITGEQIKLCIKDTGCGIPQSRIDKIFQPFERMDVHHAVEGTGLGLAITRRIVEALDGTITLKSKEGTGSCFTVLLPCEEAESIEESAETSDFELQKLNVDSPPQLLVVDDRESNRDVMKQWLELGGFDISLAANGQEALDHLRSQPCDLVLADLRMPVMSGVEMMEIIRSDERLKSIPCIAVSASVFPEQVRKVLLAGFRTFLPKPCNLGTLFSTVYEVLDLKPEVNGKKEEAPENDQQEKAIPFPETERETILDMLDMGDIEGLQEHIHSLRDTPGLRIVAEKLSHCLDELDMEGFRQILRDG
ncbi:PAS domain-containing protein [Parendozoicomonas sp. Alg238-R29]|uniref:PAS domain-containing protein n=1 Tax=Parendozoicomonas sp. Alg238-R29 TaxID=2993446 RepID=UPI00248DFD07|nr:PAS domain-containing protein [Parendozoicomonas sp. Alg238-R29]